MDAGKVIIAGSKEGEKSVKCRKVSTVVCMSSVYNFVVHLLLVGSAFVLNGMEEHRPKAHPSGVGELEPATTFLVLFVSQPAPPQGSREGSVVVETAAELIVFAEAEHTLFRSFGVVEDLVQIIDRPNAIEK